MATDDVQSEKTLVSDDGAGLEDAGSSTNEYYDRERWHDVESSDGEALKENTEPVSGSGFSAFSMGILLLIAVIAGGAGIIAAYLIPILFTPAFPTRQRTDYRTTPSLWIGYAENSVFFCEVNEPACFAVSEGGTLYIGDRKPPSIKVFESNGQPIRTISLDEAPRAIALGRKNRETDGQSDDRLVVAQADGLLLLSVDGKPLETRKFPSPNSNVRSLAVADESIFAADSGNRVVYHFGKNGEVETYGKKPGSPIKTQSDKSVSVPETLNTFGGFVVLAAPITLTVSKKTGLLHVTNPGLHRIETFTTDGHWEPSLSWQNNSADVTGFCGCCNPVGIDTLRNGRIVTTEQDVVRVKVYRRDGRLDCVVAGPEVLRRKPLNVPQLHDLPPMAEVDKTAVYVAVSGNDHVVMLDPVWRIVRQFVPLEAGPEKEERNAETKEP